MRTISSQQDDNCPAGVKGDGNVNVNGNNFGNNDVGDDLYRGVEETCSVPPSGRALDMASTCATPTSASCITRDAIMTHSKNPLHLHCRIHSLFIGSTLKWQLDTLCKSQPLVSQVGTAGADADTARVVFGSFNRLRAGGAEPCGIQRGARMDLNRIHRSHQQGGTHRS